MGAPKGTMPPHAGMGKPKGAVNKNTALKDMILQALDEGGRSVYLPTSNGGESPGADHGIAREDTPNSVGCWRWRRGDHHLMDEAEGHR